jgi:hypothetical protein
VAKVASAILEQYGSQIHPVDAELARAGSGVNHARDLHRAISRNDLAEKIPISKIQAAGETIPILRLKDFLDHMVKSHQLFRLLGNDPAANDLEKAGDVLEEFWTNFLKVHPDFWIAEEFNSGRMNPRRCIPAYTHIDEGRGVSVRT